MRAAASLAGLAPPRLGAEELPDVGQLPLDGAESVPVRRAVGVEVNPPPVENLHKPSMAVHGSKLGVSRAQNLATRHGENLLLQVVRLHVQPVDDLMVRVLPRPVGAEASLMIAPTRSKPKHSNQTRQKDGPHGRRVARGPIGGEIARMGAES